MECCFGVRASFSPSPISLCRYPICAKRSSLMGTTFLCTNVVSTQNVCFVLFCFAFFKLQGTETCSETAPAQWSHRGILSDGNFCKDT